MEKVKAQSAACRVWYAKAQPPPRLEKKLEANGNRPAWLVTLAVG